MYPFIAYIIAYKFGTLSKLGVFAVCIHRQARRCSTFQSEIRSVLSTELAAKACKNLWSGYSQVKSLFIQYAFGHKDVLILRFWFNSV